MHRPPERQGRSGVTRAQSRTGVCGCSPSARGITIHDFIMILCHVGFSILQVFEHNSQTNFPIIKTKPFKVTKYKKVWQMFRPKGVKIKIFVISLPLL